MVFAASRNDLVVAASRDDLVVAASRMHAGTMGRVMLLQAGMI